jgi:hypothetical protein
MEVWRSPRRLPFAFREDRLGFVALDEAAYRAASFLDARILAGGAVLEWAPLAEAEAAAKGLAAACDFIFHIGHVGSTLVSRVLEEGPRTFSLREPAILRDLASVAMGPETVSRLDLTLRLLGRAWRPSQRALVKATSFVGRIGPAMMGRVPDARALLMFCAPEPHMAGLLAGEASRRDMGAMAASRRDRLAMRLGARIAVEGPGEIAAMSWACELVALADIAVAAPGRTAWLDFDRFLRDPREGVTAVLDHLRGGAPPEEVAAVLASPEFGLYAKDRRHAFDAAFRARVIAAARREHQAEIALGVAWLDRLGARAPAFVAAARAAAAGRIV